MQFLVDILTESWLLTVQAAPFLLLGFLIAGVIHAFVPVEYIVRWLGGRSTRSVFNAAVLGTPLPLCSCSVVPVAASLRRSGASRGATTSFLISTPESGVDSIAATYALMDPVMTVARPAAGMATAFVAGVAQNIWNRDPQDEPTQDTQSATAAARMSSACCAEPAQAAPTPAGSCCDERTAARTAVAAGKAEVSSAPGGCCGGGADRAESPSPADARPAASCCEAPLPEAPAPVGANCCGGPPALHQQVDRSSLGGRVKTGLRYGLIEMFETLGVYLLVGFLLAGVLTVVLEQVDLLQAALASAWAPLIMLVAGVPMYVCAASATPVIAVLIAAGLSPGAGLVFLLSGPATNAASLVVLRQIIGARAIVLYLISIAGCALAAGYLVDALYRGMGWSPRMAVGAEHVHEHVSWFGIVTGLLLTALVLHGIARRHLPRLRRGVPATAEAEHSCH